MSVNISRPIIDKIKMFERDRVELIELYPNGVTRDSLKDYYSASLNDLNTIFRYSITNENGWSKKEVDGTTFYKLKNLPASKSYAKYIDKRCARIIKVLTEGATYFKAQKDTRYVDIIKGVVTQKMLINLYDVSECNLNKYWDKCVNEGYVKSDLTKLEKHDSPIGFKYTVVRQLDTLNPYLYS